MNDIYYYRELAKENSTLQEQVNITKPTSVTKIDFSNLTSDNYPPTIQETLNMDLLLICITTIGLIFILKRK